MGQSGVLERRRRERRPRPESRRPCGARTTNGRSFCSSARRDEHRARRGRRSATALTSRTRLQNPFSRGGKARGEDEEAEGVDVYQFPRLRRPPDAGGSRSRRWSSSGEGKRCPLLARAGIASRRLSGASWMAGRKLRRSEEDSAKLGALLVVRGGGRCLLPSGSSGGFRWVAGTSVMGSGWLEGSVEAVGGVCWLDDSPVRGEGNCLWC